MPVSKHVAKHTPSFRARTDTCESTSGMSVVTTATAPSGISSSPLTRLATTTVGVRKTSSWISMRRSTATTCPVRDLAKQRAKAPDQNGNRRRATGADHFLRERVDGPAVAAQSPAELVGGRLQVVVEALAGGGQGHLGAVQHRLEAQRLRLAGAAAAGRMQLLQRQHQLVVVGRAEAHVLQREREQVHDGTDAQRGEAARGLLYRQLHGQVQPQVQVNDVLVAAEVAAAVGDQVQQATARLHGRNKRALWILAALGDAAVQGLLQQPHELAVIGDFRHWRLGHPLALALAHVVAEHGLHGALQVRAAVDGLEGALVRFQVADELALVAVAAQVRLRVDGAVVAEQALPVDAALLQHPPVHPDVAVGLQVLDEGVADDHVIGRGVVVQLLVPLLHHASHTVVLALNDQNLITDPLAHVTLAAASNALQHEPAQLAVLALILVHVHDVVSEAQLRGAQLARLDVVVLVPNQLLHGRVAQPHGHRRHPLRAVPIGLVPQDARGDVVSVHEGLLSLPFRARDGADGVVRHAANVQGVPHHAEEVIHGDAVARARRVGLTVLSRRRRRRCGRRRGARTGSRRGAAASRILDPLGWSLAEGALVQPSLQLLQRGADAHLVPHLLARPLKLLHLLLRGELPLAALLPPNVRPHLDHLLRHVVDRHLARRRPRGRGGLRRGLLNVREPRGGRAGAAAALALGLGCWGRCRLHGRRGWAQQAFLHSGQRQALGVLGLEVVQGALEELLLRVAPKGRLALLLPQQVGGHLDQLVRDGGLA
eukprot:scaffold3544_cov373-Prasinococcus_capsulatus_cf.AAC.2